MRGSRDNCQGVQVLLPENSSDTLGFLFFLVLKLFYSFTEGIQWLFQRKLLFSKVSEGVQLFKGGGATFSWGWGFQMLISIETHITCDFPGGGGSGPPTPLLDLHMRFHNLFFLISKENISCGFPKVPLKKTIHLSTKTNFWTYR